MTGQVDESFVIFVNDSVLVVSPLVQHFYLLGALRTLSPVLDHGTPPVCGVQLLPDRNGDSPQLALIARKDVEVLVFAGEGAMVDRSGG
eukprot:CAMPEP_0184304650 /NCGR_PEP_ID=MMETSP1049-20130417/14107_1 /TAXON_ID=77928 /ORGANISM="Proteomonas sulcata, Strain CCMP704" /LENGTH=88 /DNA_ID=CAMNT_0026616497 /DNA_START=501 /DNA_END=768 /DNA_ORIENTATION=-